MVAELFKIRIAVMAKVDGKKLPVKSAETEIQRRFAKRLGGRQYTAIYGRQNRTISRFASLRRIGLDVNQSATIRRPSAGSGQGLISCPTLQSAGQSAGGGRVRCY